MESRTGNIKHRTLVLRAIAISIASIIVAKLFYLQIMKHDHYEALAESQHQEEVIIKARRGDILTKDRMGGYATLATDVALNTIYIDPAIVKPEDEQMIVDMLAPLLFEIPDEKTKESDLVEQADALISSEKQNESLTATGSEVSPATDANGNSIAPPLTVPKAQQPRESYEKLLEQYKQDLTAQIQHKEVNYIELASKPSEALTADVESLNIRGVFVTKDAVYADPTIMRENEEEEIAGKLGALLNKDPVQLERSLKRRAVRYIAIKRGVSPEIAGQIQQAKLTGVGVLPEYHRYYPEQTTASSIIGFINNEGVAQYGVEEQFDDATSPVSLHGTDGHILIDRDPQGRQIAVGEMLPTPAKNGDNVVLTIDRVVQEKVEEILKRGVEQYQASGGSAIVMDPYTGAVIAMANYPGFNPNEYWKSLQKYTDGAKAGEYINGVGVKAFKNPSVDESYEPGSIFKIITMSAGIDAGEIEPDMVQCQPLAVVYRDNYPIRNSDLRAPGCMTMSQVLEHSSNLGALWVAEKLGRTLFYKYIKDFGFGDLTDFDLQQEVAGWLRQPHNWANVDLAAAGFGQGIAVTPLQMVAATSAIANGGKLMRPYLVQETISGQTGEKTEIQSQVIRQVISPETASKVSAMMVGVVNGVYGRELRIPGYNLAAKTGTAQIAKGGGYEKGQGSTMASLIGFAPVENPKFVVLVRLERPRTSPWAEGTAGPVWHDITQWLLDYYGVEPNK